jgi:hypothetical protein
MIQWPLQATYDTLDHNDVTWCVTAVMMMMEELLCGEFRRIHLLVPRMVT